VPITPELKQVLFYPKTIGMNGPPIDMETRSSFCSAILLEADLVRVLAEAASTHVQSVLADESLVRLTHPTTTGSLAMILRMAIPYICVAHVSKRSLALPNVRSLHSTAAATNRKSRAVPCEKRYRGMALKRRRGRRGAMSHCTRDTCVQRSGQLARSPAVRVQAILQRRASRHRTGIL